MTRIESELLDLVESISRNDNTASVEDYQTLFGLATDAGEVEEENERLKEKIKKLVTLVCHLMYVKPRDVTGIMYNGEVLRFDELLEEVGLRWEDA